MTWRNRTEQHRNELSLVGVLEGGTNVILHLQSLSLGPVSLLHALGVPSPSFRPHCFLWRGGVLALPHLTDGEPEGLRAEVAYHGPQPVSGGSRMWLYVQVGLLTRRDVYHVLLHEKVARRATEYTVGESH